MNGPVSDRVLVAFVVCLLAPLWIALLIGVVEVVRLIP